MDKTDLSKSISYFEKALIYLNKDQGQYYSANWFIGHEYRILLQTEGLSYNEVSRMLQCYKIYLDLNPDAEDAKEILSFVSHTEDIRPQEKVLKWINIPQGK